MSRWLRGVAFAAVLLAPCARAADDLSNSAEDAWKNLVMQALYAAGEKDFAKSEQIFLKAVHEAERFGAGDVRVGTTLNSLGLVYRSEKKYGDANAAFRRALAILDKAYGPESIDVANVNFNVASVAMDEGKQQEALPFLLRSRIVFEKQLGGGSLKTAEVLCMIGDSYRAIKSYEQAETPLKRCAEIREADGGMLNNRDLGDALNSLALVYQKEGKYALADPEFKLAEKVRERALGITSPALAETLEAHAAMLKQMGRDVDAQKNLSLAAAIRRSENKNR